MNGHNYFLLVNGRAEDLFGYTWQELLCMRFEDSLSERYWGARVISIHGRPPLRCLRGLGSKGVIFFHCASLNKGPDRAIGPPSALLTLLMDHFA